MRKLRVHLGHAERQEMGAQLAKHAEMQLKTAVDSRSESQSEDLHFELQLVQLASDLMESQSECLHFEMQLVQPLAEQTEAQSESYQ